MAAVTNGHVAKEAPKSRGALKRQKKKAKKGTEQPAVDSDARVNDDREDADRPAAVEDSITDDVEIDPAFQAVFARFAIPEEETSQDGAGAAAGGGATGEDGKGEIIYSDDEQMSEGEEANAAAELELSKRRQKKLNRLSVAELKRLVRKPEVVEWVDVSATDPRLLVQIKSYRNTVPIPPHWSQKRDYLAGKRGIEKPAFQLPGFIADTGIASQRDAIKEKEEGMSLKGKMREKVQPKMGKIDIDYQKLHDAFFKFQTKPPLTDFGELYYEGKEFETKLKEKRPGDLSHELQEALSIPPLAPPPWLISMQRYGPPPSYPTLKIPGLNAPIPEGAAWGFHPGGWGKPPLDDYGRPLYGDIYGVAPQQDDSLYGEPIEKDPWGELEPDEEGSSDEDSDDDSDDEPISSMDGLQTPSGGLETPSGMASVTSTVPGGLETPDFLDLRKRRDPTEVEDDHRGPRSLYQVIPERESRMQGFLGNDRAYDTSGINREVLGVEDTRTGKRKAGGVDVSIDAEELEGLSQAQLEERYRQGGSKNAGQPNEDFSDYVTQEANKRRKLAESKKKDAAAAREKEKFKF